MSAGCAANDSALDARRLLTGAASIEAGSYSFSEVPIGGLLACVMNARSIEGGVDLDADLVWFTGSRGELIALSDAGRAIVHSSLLTDWSVSSEWVDFGQIDEKDPLSQSLKAAVGDELSTALSGREAAPSPSAYADATAKAGSALVPARRDDGRVEISTVITDSQLGDGVDTSPPGDLDVRLVLDSSGRIEEVTAVLAAPHVDNEVNGEFPLGVTVRFDFTEPSLPSVPTDIAVADQTMLPARVSLRGCT